MASPVSTILPPIAGTAAHWRQQIEDQLARVRREHRAEILEGHPGARHRVATLLIQEGALLGQLAELEARERVAR